MVYIIAHDLRTPGQNYSLLHEAIRGLGSYCHPETSVWFVDSKCTSHQILDRLLPFIVDCCDLLFIGSLAGEFDT